MNNKNQSPSWDFKRFWQTLSYFEIIPFISCWQRLFNPQSQQNNQQTKMKILVVGATGGVGKRVVKNLVQQGYDVTALVRDAKRGQDILGDGVQLFAADLTIAETLNSRNMEGISTVICCSGTKVQPAEGDTPNREKYYQGIKFYLPEVADSPEQVEYEGIKNLIEVVSQNIQPATEKV